MDSTIWKQHAQYLSLTLRPLTGDLKRDDPISFCMRRRSAMMNFIKMSKTDEGKSVHVARLHMISGDSAFELKSFKICLEDYTVAVMSAPNNSSHLSNAYVKRSFILLGLGAYNEACRDLNMALSNGLSRKRFFQKVIELIHSGEYKKAERCLYDILMKLKLLPTGLCGEMEFDADLIRYINAWKQSLPTVKNGENPTFPSSSNCLEVLYDKNKGHYVVAKDDIEPGDVLFVEKAFVFSLESKHCQNCCQKNIAPIPCHNCILGVYCSEECRDSAWKSHHRFICGFTLLLKNTGVGELALMIILKAASNYEELRTVLQQFMRKKKLDGAPITFSKNPYDNVYYLQTHCDSMDVEDFLQYSLTATLLALYLVHHTKYAPPTNDNIKFIGEILLHHITQITSNCSTITAPIDSSALSVADQYDREIHWQNIGAGVYPSVAMMNHSCEPSVITWFHKDVMVVVASRDISSGEEVFNNYGAYCRTMSRPERRERLRSLYIMECNCPSCSEEHDPYDLMNKIRCISCGSPCMAIVNEPPFYLPDKNCCENCNAILYPGQYLCLTGKLEELLASGMIKRDEKDIEGGLNDSVKAWTIAKNVFDSFHELLFFSASTSLTCFLRMGDFKSCIVLLKCCIAWIRVRYGYYSVVHALEIKKLCEVIFLYCKKKVKPLQEEMQEIRSLKTAGLQYCDICEGIFKLLLGEDCQFVLDIRTCKTRFQNDITIIL